MPTSTFELLALNFLSPLPSIHGGHDSESGLLGLVDKLLEALISAMAGGWSLFSGIELLGLNVHPLIVHFPIALLASFIVIDTFGAVFKLHGWRRLGTQLLGLGALSTLPTIAAGFYAAFNTPHDAVTHAIMEHHQHAGIVVGVISSVLALWRILWGIPKELMARTLCTILTLILAVALSLGADLGATMVYGHGVAVKTSPAAELPVNHVHGEESPAKPGH
ncbi:MAG TPA: hypothetical protein DCY52_09530 [Methylococcaceae bacterium]|jgi:uncharacterized membrane protein|nr:hypothetical protein [Methylococcaceae bacterium]